MDKATKTILVVDDEPDMTRAVALTITLQEPQWRVLPAHSGEDALNVLETGGCDAVLLDLQMPGLHGLDVLAQIRLYSDVPVIVLTVRDDELDKVHALQLGADDYVVKPFGHLELVARLQSVLRRAAGVSGPVEPPLTLGRLRLDRESRFVEMDGRAVPLTSTEYRILELLARSAGRVVTTEALLARVWGSDAMDDTDYVKTYIHRLRVKLEEDPAAPCYLLTARGVGYWMPRHPQTVAGGK